MSRFLLKIRRLVFQEKIYLYLLLSAIFFHLVVFAVDHFFSERSGQRLPEVKTQVETTSSGALASADVWNDPLARHPDVTSEVQVFVFATYGLMICGVIFGFVALNRLMRREELIPHSTQQLGISWSVLHVARLMIVYVWFGIVLNLMFLALKVMFHQANMSYFLLLHTMALDLIVVFFIGWNVIWSGGRLKDLLGFDWRQISVKEVLYGFSAYMAVFPLFIAVLFVLVFFAGLFSYEPTPHPLVSIFEEGAKRNPFLIWFSVFLACVIGPIIEEIFFRGFLYPAVKKSWGKRWALLLSAGLFAGVHESLFAFLPVFFLGLVLCYLYEKRKSVLPCISFHVIHNSVLISYFFAVKNLMN